MYDIKTCLHVWFILNIYFVYISIPPITLPLTANVRPTRFVAVAILFPTFCCSSVALPYETLPVSTISSLHAAYLSTPVVAVAGSCEMLAHLQQTTRHPILEKAVLKAVYFNLDVFLQSSLNALQVSGFMVEVAGSETQKRIFKLNRSSQYPKMLL